MKKILTVLAVLAILVVTALGLASRASAAAGAQEIDSAIYLSNGSLCSSTSGCQLVVCKGAVCWAAGVSDTIHYNGPAAYFDLNTLTGKYGSWGFTSWMTLINLVIGDHISVQGRQACGPGMFRYSTYRNYTYGGYYDYAVGGFQVSSVCQPA